MRVLRCEGAPRDLGGDQGRMLGDLLRARHGGVLPRLPALSGTGRGARVPRVLRAMRRHYPHQYEQLSGMARGAGMSFSKLARASVATLLRPTRGLGFRSELGAQLAVAVPGDALIRDAHPAGRFAAVELTRPSLTSALLAVNEAGLAVASDGRVCDAGCQAPAALLARDCVERFESVAAATEWCLTRPCAPGTTLLFADARAELAAVEIADAGRRVLSPVDGVLLPGARAERASELAKCLGDSGAVQASLQRLLGPYASADPAACSLFAQDASQAATASSGTFATAK